MNQNRSLEELLFHMPALARRTANEWEAGFARSILRHSKRPGWAPTAKQQRIMQRMVADLFSGSQQQEALDLIDNGDRHDAA